MPCSSSLGSIIAVADHSRTVKTHHRAEMHISVICISCYDSSHDRAATFQID